MATTKGPVEAVELYNAAQNVSAWGLFVQADWVVKIVVFLLLLASFWCWVVIFDKLLRLRRLNMLSTDFENRFWSGKSLDTLYDKIGSAPADPLSAVFVEAMAEWKRANVANLSLENKETILDRIERVMGITITREMEKLERFVIFLASVGSTAPFIGLFGTVWGIMNSFQAIAITQNTSLAAVAPGIAEALFATALGLVAAIPSVIAYNKINGDLNRYASRLETFAGEFSAIVSRQLDEKLAQLRGKKVA